MLRRLKDVKGYLTFIDEVMADPVFRPPMPCGAEELRCDLLKAPDRPDHQVWGVFEGETLRGLFSLLVLEEEAYIELLAGLCRSGEADREVLAFLGETYPGYQADFVFNPENRPLGLALEEAGARFDPRQQKMVLKKAAPHRGGRQVELYSPRYRRAYCEMHRTDGYWTPERVLDAPERFRVLLAIERGEVAGYVDVTYQYEENEPFDVFVGEKYRRRGYARAMLERAIQLNGPRGMMLRVDVDNVGAIALYESLGFVKEQGADSVTAHVDLRRAPEPYSATSPQRLRAK